MGGGPGGSDRGQGWPNKKRFLAALRRRCLCSGGGVGGQSAEDDLPYKEGVHIREVGGSISEIISRLKMAAAV